jgi:hypothetical protein
MRSHTLAALLALVALTTLPGCVISLFSDSKVSDDTLARTEQLENRMDRVDEAMQQRSATPK